MYSISQKLYALTGSFFVSIFSDPDGLLELSREQKEAGVLWRRPREVFANAKIFFPELRPEDIVQRIVADCSLCASIVVCLLHCRTHNSKVCTIFHSLELLVSVGTLMMMAHYRRPYPLYTPEDRTDGCIFLRQASMNSKCYLTVPIDEYALVPIEK